MTEIKQETPSENQGGVKGGLFEALARYHQVRSGRYLAGSKGPCDCTRKQEESARSDYQDVVTGLAKAVEHYVPNSEALFLVMNAYEMSQGHSDQGNPKSLAQKAYATEAVMLSLESKLQGQEKVAAKTFVAAAYASAADQANKEGDYAVRDLLIQKAEAYAKDTGVTDSLRESYSKQGYKTEQPRPDNNLGPDTNNPGFYEKFAGMKGQQGMNG